MKYLTKTREGGIVGLSPLALYAYCWQDGMMSPVHEVIMSNLDSRARKTFCQNNIKIKCPYFVPSTQKGCHVT